MDAQSVIRLLSICERMVITRGAYQGLSLKEALTNDQQGALQAVFRGNPQINCYIKTVKQLVELARITGTGPILNVAPPPPVQQPVQPDVQPHIDPANLQIVPVNRPAPQHREAVPVARALDVAPPEPQPQPFELRGLIQRAWARFQRLPVTLQWGIMLIKIMIVGMFPRLVGKVVASIMIRVNGGGTQAVTSAAEEVLAQTMVSCEGARYRGGFDCAHDAECDRCACPQLQRCAKVVGGSSGLWPRQILPLSSSRVCRPPATPTTPMGGAGRSQGMYARSRA